MERKQVYARILLIALMVVILVTASVVIGLRRLEEKRSEEAVRNEEGVRQQAEMIGQLVSWITEMRLKYGITEEPPVLPEEAEEGEESGMLFEGENTSAAAEDGGAAPGEGEKDFAAAGPNISGGFDWRAIVAGCQAPGWQFTDNPEEFIAWAFYYSNLEGDATGKSSHLWRTGQALRNGWQTWPMSDGFRQAARDLYAAACIDDLLRGRGSPLAGYGVCFVLAGRRYGVSPYLLVALTAAESTFATDGSLCRTHHNAWGMTGPNKTGLVAEDGWMWWESWPAAIDGAAYFVSAYWPGARTAYDLRGYCAGNPPAWIECVEHFRSQLEYLGGEL